MVIGQFINKMFWYKNNVLFLSYYKTVNRIKDIFRALKYRNFRLFFPGLAISQIGIWIQNVAISWFIYDITKSPFIMGIVMFFNSIPLFLLTPFAGVIADKFDRQKLLLTVQILYTVQALLMTIFSYFGYLKIWNIILLGIFLNCIAAVDAPLRQSTFVLVVDDKKDLGNAISLNSSCFNLARLLGPAIGGLLLAKYNINICFLVNFLCLLPIVILVRMMKINDKKDEKIKNETMLEGLKEGLDYVITTPKINTLILYIGFYCFLIMIYPMLMPIYTIEVLHSHADILGYLLGAAGVGSLISSLLLAMKKTTSNIREIILSGMAVACTCFIMLGFTHSSIIALILMFGVGLGSTSVFTPENMLLQSVIDDDKRGRVMSINSLSFLGTTAISSLFAGSVAHIFGISNTFIILGVIMLLIGLTLSFRLSKLDFSPNKSD